MPTFKTVIHPRYKKADGVFRVKIRITHNWKIQCKLPPKTKAILPPCAKIILPP